MKKIVACFLLVFASPLTYAQLGIGTNKPDNSAVLDLASTKQGLLPPRMTTAQRDAINGGNIAEGLVIYNTDDKCLQHWNGSDWKCSGNGGDGGGTQYRSSFQACAGLTNVKDAGELKATPLSFVLGGNNLIYSTVGGFHTLSIDPNLHDDDVLLRTHTAQPVHSISEALPDIKWKKIESHRTSRGGYTWDLFLLSEDGRLFSLQYSLHLDNTKQLESFRGWPHAKLSATYENQITPLEIKAKDANGKNIIWENIIFNSKGKTVFAYGNGEWYEWGSGNRYGNSYPDSIVVPANTITVEQQATPQLVNLLNTKGQNIGKALGKENTVYIDGSVYIWIDEDGKVNINDHTYCRRKGNTCSTKVGSNTNYHLDKAQRQLEFPSSKVKAVKLATNGSYGWYYRSSTAIYNYQEVHVIGSDGKAYVYSPASTILNPTPDSNNTLRLTSLPSSVKVVDLAVTKYYFHNHSTYRGTYALTDKGELYHYLDNNQNKNNHYSNLTKHLKLPKIDKILHTFQAQDLVVRSKETGHLIQITNHQSYLYKEMTDTFYFDDAMNMRNATDSTFKATYSDGKTYYNYYWSVLWKCSDTAFVSE